VLVFLRMGLHLLGGSRADVGCDEGPGSLWVECNGLEKALVFAGRPDTSTKTAGVVGWVHGAGRNR
jgi:hypothetical protein